MITTNEVEYEVWLAQPNGVRIKTLDEAISLSALRVVNGFGHWSIPLPGDFDRNLLRKDAIIEILRKPPGGSQREFMSGFLRWRKFERDQITIAGPGLPYILSSRIVAYAAGTAEADQTDFADDMMKEIVDHNLGADATDTNRDLSTYLSTAAQTGSGPSITKAFAWKKVYPALLDIAKTANQEGTAVYFDVVKTGVSTFEFRTYTGQPGVDNTYPDGKSPVIFGLEFGNLEDPVYEEDFQDEVTYVYAGGRGVEEERVISEQEDTARSGESIWARREAFQEARNEGASDGVSAAGKAALQDGRPRRTFSGTLIDAEQTRYGVHWNWGDRVTVTFAGQQFDGLVSHVNLRVSANQVERLTGRVMV